MIAFVEGKLAATSADSVILQVGGFGVTLRVASSTVSQLGPIGSHVKLATRLLVRDDHLELFGFPDDRTAMWFDQLQTVAGVGPRTALAVLSAFTPDQLQAVLENDDLAALTRVSGLGKKTASRIILELRGKLTAVGQPPARDETFDALAALGYSTMEIEQALRQREVQTGATLEERLTAALRYLGGGS
jgi:Holliday junction DNA helicase RuvA